MKKAVAVLVLAVVMAGVLFAQSEEAQETQNTESDFSAFYENQLFHWNYGTFGGLKLDFQNIESSISVLSMNPIAKNALISYPDSSKEYDSFRWKSITSNVMVWGGLGVVLLGGLLPPIIMGRDYMTNNPQQAIGTMLGLMGGGLVIEIIGVFINASGISNLFKSVNLYNTHKARESN